MAQTFEITDPAALAYLEGKPAGQAQLKAEPADFRVDEVLGFTPSGSGEHLFIQLRKTNLSTTEVARLLSKQLRVPDRGIGYAGMKDRRAETTQWFSVVLDQAREAELEGLQQSGLEVLQCHRNSRKLKTGSHKANAFNIVLREFSGNREEVERRLHRLQEAGVPNYFGQQRFGRQLSNLKQLQRYVVEESDSVAQGRVKRGMLYSAARAWVFNHLLSRRLQMGNWNRYLEGDVLNLAGTQRSFVVDPGAWDAKLQGRLDELDIHITGILPGVQSDQDKYATRGEPADIETVVLEEFASLVAALCRWGLQADRRPLRFRVDDLRWGWQTEQELELAFTLPRGAYATSLLREVCQLTEASVFGE
jgi:tRNA pseudouridine13 synthase